MGCNGEGQTSKSERTGEGKTGREKKWESLINGACCLCIMERQIILKRKKNDGDVQYKVHGTGLNINAIPFVKTSVSFQFYTCVTPKRTSSDMLKGGSCVNASR